MSTPRAILVCGLPGSGKSTLAAALAPRLDAEHLSSDRIRGELGLRGDYGRAAIDRVYDEMTARAEAALRRGRSALLDATFSSDRYRRSALAAAAALGVEVALIEVHADEETTLRRVGRERAESEAKEGVYRLLRGRFDPIEGEHLRLDSSDAPVEALAEAALTWLDGPRTSD